MTADTHHHKKNAGLVLRENLESIAIAIILALLIRQIVLEAFKIPTGSMAPTLLGIHKEVQCPNCDWTFNVGEREVKNMEGNVECPNCHWVWRGAGSTCAGGQAIRFRPPAWLWDEARCRATGEVFRGRDGANRVLRGGSRVMVSKFTYKLPWRKPHRWEVVVFLFPKLKAHCRKCGWEWETYEVPQRCPECQSPDIGVERRNFIKRLAGLPGDQLQLVKGDLYVNGEIARKPAWLQRQLWLHVFDSLYWPRELKEVVWPGGHVFEADDDHWTRSGTDFILDAEDGAEKPALVRFTRTVNDHYAYDALSEQFVGADAVSGKFRVDDVCLACRIVPERAGGLMLVLTGRFGKLVAAIPVGDLSRQPAVRIFFGKDIVAEKRLKPLPLGRAVDVEFWQADRAAYLWIGGELALKYDLDPRPAEGSDDENPQSIAFWARGARIRFQRIQIKRDIYYTPGGHNLDEPLTVKPDHYVFLGDNSPDSNDSRSWERPEVAQSYIAGRAFLSFWPIQEGRTLSAVKPVGKAK